MHVIHIYSDFYIQACSLPHKMHKKSQNGYQANKMFGHKLLLKIDNNFHGFFLLC